MAVRGARAVDVLLILGFLGYQFLSHRITVAGELTASGAAIMLLPVVGAGTWAIVTEFGARAAVLTWLALALCAAASLHWWGLPNPALVYGLPHFAANAFLLWFFARTLRAGRQPLITRIARRLRGKLPPPIEVYTRRVTIAWSVFFASQIAASFVLYAFASLPTWSLFVNIVSSLLIPVMFVAEYAVRRRLFRDFAHVSIFEGSDIFRDDDVRSKPADR